MPGKISKTFNFYSKNPTNLVNDYGIAIPSAKLSICGIPPIIPNEDLRDALLNLDLNIKCVKNTKSEVLI